MKFSYTQIAATKNNNNANESLRCVRCQKRKKQNKKEETVNLRSCMVVKSKNGIYMKSII